MDKNQLAKLKGRAQKSKGKVKGHEKLTEEINYSKLPPVFDIQCNHHKYCLEKFDDEVKKSFAATLHTMAKLTWQMIETTDKRGLGYEKMSLSEIKPESSIELTPDVRVKVFRITDESRIAGVRLKDNIFTILWVAPKHDLY